MYDVLVYVFENCQQYELSDQKDRVAKKLTLTRPRPSPATVGDALVKGKLPMETQAPRAVG